MNENKTIIGLLIIIIILGAALAYLYFFTDGNIIHDTETNFVFNPGETSRKAMNAVANKTYDYTHSVEEEKQDYNGAEQEIDAYTN